MSDIDDFRRQIDKQDEIIMEALEKRFEISHLIGKIKKQNKIKVTDSNRENEVLNRCEKYQFSSNINHIYQSIFSESKRIQNQYFALVGSNISHSLSPDLHKEIANIDYEIIDTGDFESVLEAKAFTGLNVTIPYKTTAFKLVDELSPETKKTFVVNTIINQNGKLIGHNTDYLAFQRLLDVFDVNVKNKKIIIIGNGATARTVKAVLEQHHPKMIINLVRTIRNDNEALISQYEEFIDYNIIINTTPYGSVPNLEDAPFFELYNFYHLETVIDVIYQPLNSPLLIAASKNSERQIINGLYMLIAQAFYADELFLNKKLDSTIIDKVYQKYYHNLSNIVLIGMPSAGKTTIGKIVAKLTDREFIDTDQELVKQGRDLDSVIEKSGTIKQFRKYESDLIEKLALVQNKVIATGGGSILDPRNVQLLKANGVLIWLSPDFKTLIKRFDNTKPLTKTVDDLEKLFLERLNYYVAAKDIIFNNNGNAEDDAKKVLEKYYEYLNY